MNGRRRYLFPKKPVALLSWTLKGITFLKWNYKRRNVKSQVFILLRLSRACIGWQLLYITHAHCHHLHFFYTYIHIYKTHFTSRYDGTSRSRCGRVLRQRQFQRPPYRLLRFDFVTRRSLADFQKRLQFFLCRSI